MGENIKRGSGAAAFLLIHVTAHKLGSSGQSFSPPESAGNLSSDSAACIFMRSTSENNYSRTFVDKGKKKGRDP